MPASIISGFIEFIAQNLHCSVWDGETPRTDINGNPINPSSTVVPTDWPVVKLYMKEPGFTREDTTEDPYDDLGEILIQIWGTSRQQIEGTLANPQAGLLNQIETLLNQASNWPLIPLGGPVENPYYVVWALLRQWYSGQEEGVRTASSELLYRADMHYSVMIHGAVSAA